MFNRKYRALSNRLSGFQANLIGSFMRIYGQADVNRLPSTSKFIQVQEKHQKGYIFFCFYGLKRDASD